MNDIIAGRPVADVGVAQGYVVAQGNLSDEASQTIDVSSLALAPGFIDLHTHSDTSFLIDKEAQSKVRQGYTLKLRGNCGMSFCAPLMGEARQIGADRLAAHGAQDLLDWTRFEEHLERLEQAGSTLNLAIQVGHGTVRLCVMGFDDRAPTLEELDRMRKLVAESLGAGALGFSTVLYYAPGSYTCTDKVVVLSREVAKRDKLYSTHMRDKRDFSIGLFGPVEEVLAISRLSGVRLQISHLKCVGPALGETPRNCWNG